MLSIQKHHKIISGAIVLAMLGGIFATPVISNDSYAAGTVASSSSINKNQSKSKSNSSSKTNKNNKNNDDSGDAESGYADPQGVRKTLNDNLNTMQDASDKFSTALTVLIIALIALPVLGVIFFVVRHILRSR